MITKDKINNITDWIYWICGAKGLEYKNIHKSTKKIFLVDSLQYVTMNPYIQDLDDLEQLDFSLLNFIQSFDVTHKNIKKISIELNSIKVVNINCPNLEYLNIANNKIKVIDNIYAPKLKTFICDENIIFKENNNLYQLAKKNGCNPQLMQESSLKENLF